jgi:hypothetical protein
MMFREMGAFSTAGNLHHEIRGGDFHRAFIHERHRRVKRIKDLLSLAAIGDHVIAAKQTEMMAYGRLRKPQFLAKGSNIPLTPGEGQENVQARFVGKQSKEGNKLIQILVRCHGIQQRHTISCSVSMNSWQLVLV